MVLVTGVTVTVVTVEAFTHPGKDPKKKNIYIYFETALKLGGRGQSSIFCPQMALQHANKLFWIVDDCASKVKKGKYGT